MREGLCVEGVIGGAGAWGDIFPTFIAPEPVLWGGADGGFVVGGDTAGEDGDGIFFREGGDFGWGDDGAEGTAAGAIGEGDCAGGDDFGLSFDGEGGDGGSDGDEAAEEGDEEAAFFWGGILVEEEGAGMVGAEVAEEVAECALTGDKDLAAGIFS